MIRKFVLTRNQTIVCRPSKAEATGVEVIAWFHDEDVCGHGIFHGLGN